MGISFLIPDFFPKYKVIVFQFDQKLFRTSYYTNLNGIVKNPNQQ